MNAQQEESKMHFVRATSEATVSANPDRAHVSIGIINQAGTAQAAAGENAAQTNEVMGAIKRALGTAGELSTSGYSLSPQYQTGAGQIPKINGYQASNTVLVTVTNLRLLGEVLDVATGSGANKIHGVTFSLKDDFSVRNQALAEAAVKARAAAETMAKALGMQIVGVVRAESGHASNIRPMLTEFTRGGVSTTIEAGDLDITAIVTVTLEVQ